MPKTSTVATAVEDYLYDKRKLRAKTKKGYSQRLSEFTSWCCENDIDLDDIKAKTVNQFLEHKQNTIPNVSSYTLKGYGRVVKGFLNWCTKDETYEDEVKVKTVNRIELPKVEQSVITTFTADEVKDLFDATKQEDTPFLVARNRAILALLLDTGIRASELAFDSDRPEEKTGLRMDQIDLLRRDPHIRVLGKGNKEREIGLGTRSRGLLERYVSRYRKQQDHDYVFVGRSGAPLSVRGLEMMITRVAEQARVKEAHPHKFRHTFAVNYLLQSKDDADGAGLVKLMMLMGHTKISTTQIYLRAIDFKQARKGGSVLDNLGK